MNIVNGFLIAAVIQLGLATTSVAGPFVFEDTNPIPEVTPEQVVPVPPVREELKKDKTCMPKEEALLMLEKLKYDIENPFFLGYDRTRKMLFEVFRAPGGRWTQLVTDKNQEACVIGSGYWWRSPYLDMA